MSVQLKWTSVAINFCELLLIILIGLLIRHKLKIDVRYTTMCATRAREPQQQHKVASSAFVRSLLLSLAAAACACIRSRRVPIALDPSAHALVPTHARIGACVSSLDSLVRFSSSIAAAPAFPSAGPIHATCVVVSLTCSSLNILGRSQTLPLCTNSSA